VEWLSKEFLLAVCGALLIALISVSWSRPLIQSLPPQTQESPGRSTGTDGRGNSLDYLIIRSYVNSAAAYCTSERPNAPSEWRKRFICDSKITDVVIAILTAFLMIFTGLLVRVGSRQETTTRQQMRAFVYLNDGGSSMSPPQSIRCPAISRPELKSSPVMRARSRVSLSKTPVPRRRMRWFIGAVCISLNFHWLANCRPALRAYKYHPRRYLPVGSI
jgi:hypothetical protein